MSNLKEETIGIINKNGYSVDDVTWVGNGDFEIPLDRFWELADREYDSGFGSEEVATDIVVAMKDGSWLERHECDGSEWWEFKRSPQRPSKVLHGVFAVMRSQAPRDSWGYELADMNKPVLEASDA